MPQQQHKMQQQRPQQQQLQQPQPPTQQQYVAAVGCRIKSSSRLSSDRLVVQIRIPGSACGHGLPSCKEDYLKSWSHLDVKSLIRSEVSVFSSLDNGLTLQQPIRRLQIRGRIKLASSINDLRTSTSKPSFRGHQP